MCISIPPGLALVYATLCRRKEEGMKINKNIRICTANFWYDLLEGNIKPEDVCKNKKDAKRVKKAVETLNEFTQSCDNHMDGYWGMK